MIVCMTINETNKKNKELHNMENDDHMNLLQLDAHQRHILDMESYIRQQNFRDEIKIRIARSKELLSKVEDWCDTFRESVYSIEDKVIAQEEVEFERWESKYLQGVTA